MEGDTETIVEKILDDATLASPKERLLKAFEEATPSQRVELAKSSSAGSVDRVGFEATTEGSVGTLWKSDDEFSIWGPASVEVVDKENDRIEASALEEALPQLMKRQRLSYEHADQIVGEIREKIETDDPVEVEFNGVTEKRDTFPTDVLKLDGMDHPALFVAGSVYNDTKKCREVREAIEKGDINSYSISGEAIVTSMSIEDGTPVTDISKLDLSAITLCREGMNQMAKFDVVKKTASGRRTQRLAFAKSSEGTDGELTREQADRLLKTMGDNEPLTKSGMNDLLDKHLPDGEIATRKDVESIAREQAETVFKENATNTRDESEGTSDRPSGDDSSPTEQDDDYEGDMPDETASDSDKVEEKSGGFTTEQLKSILPSDQFKAIEPLLERADDPMEEDPMMEDDEEDEMPPEEPGLDEVAEPELEDPDMDDEEEVEIVEEKAKALNLDPQMLTDDQMARLAKADLSALQKAEGVGNPGTGDNSPNFMNPDDDDIEKSIEKGEGQTLAGGNFFGGDGGVQL
jgi:hypothetical protein